MLLCSYIASCYDNIICVVHIASDCTLTPVHMLIGLAKAYFELCSYLAMHSYMTKVSKASVN